MGEAWGVIAIYAGLAFWVCFLAWGYRRGNYTAFIWFGMALMLYLNIRYLIEGAPAGIAFFIGIYDVVINLGLSPDRLPAAMAECAGNECSVLGDQYTRHPAWGVAFYERFANGSDLRSSLLYGHLTCNSIVFVLMHIQMMKPGYGENVGLHKWLGRMSFVLITIGVGCAVWLASEHGSVEAYGGKLAEYGFYSMSAFVYATMLMGVVAIRGRDHARHRVWMWRFAGSMWGSFWLFRAMLLVLDPLFRDAPSVAILSCIWFSAPLGILIAEMIRRALDRRGMKTSGMQAAE